MAEFDALDYLQSMAERAAEVLGAVAAGLIVGDDRGQFMVLASTSQEARVLEVFQVLSSEGPCLECYRTGQPQLNLDLTQDWASDAR